MLARLTSRELSEWMAYDAVEGLPDRRLELLLAQLLAMTANIHRDPKARREPVGALEFMPWLREDDDDEPERVDLTDKIRALAALFGDRTD